MDINKYIREHWHEDTNTIAKALGIKPAIVRGRGRNMGLPKRAEVQPKTEDTPERRMTVLGTPQSEQKGVHSYYDDKVILNWTTRTIITDLGEFGQYVCSFDTHKAIQRSYVVEYEGGSTSSEVAMQFDFAHSKAVLLYAKIHGFTKSSIPQTDIEFAEGLKAEDSAEENLRAEKRRAMKLTQKKKWKQVQQDADKWKNFEQSVFMPTKDWIKESLPKYRPQIFKASKSSDRFAAVVGVSDWHFMKLCYDNGGRVTYNREIAVKRLTDANRVMLSKTLRHGKPDKFYIPVGTDNLHVDNPELMTTKGTEQAGQTDGNWHLDLDYYAKTVMNMIDLYAQVAPVEVISIPGNHDKNTSRMLRVMLSAIYEKNPRVTVRKDFSPRIYSQYGSVASMFTHGDDISASKFKGSVHKMFMAEAQDQGIDIASVKHWVAYSGHLHTEIQQDLGVVQWIVLPSLSSEDYWHKEMGYVGNRQKALIDVLDKNHGRVAVFYS